MAVPSLGQSPCVHPLQSPEVLTQRAGSFTPVLCAWARSCPASSITLALQSCAPHAGVQDRNSTSETCPGGAGHSLQSPEVLTQRAGSFTPVLCAWARPPRSCASIELEGAPGSAHARFSQEGPRQSMNSRPFLHSARRPASQDDSMSEDVPWRSWSFTPVSQGLDTASWFIHSSPVRLGETRPGLALDRTRRHSWQRSRAFRPRGFKPFDDLSNAHPERAGPCTPTSRESAQRLRQLHLQVTAPEQTMIKARALRQTLAPESISKRLSAALLCVPTENKNERPDQWRKPWELVRPFRLPRI